MMMTVMLLMMMMMMMMTVARLRICTASSYNSSGVPTITWPIENKLSQCLCSPATTPFSLVVLRLHSSLCFKILILASSALQVVASLSKFFPKQIAVKRPAPIACREFAPCMHACRQ
jgi:hypothetical protein